MAQCPDTENRPVTIETLRKSLTVAPMSLPLTGLSMFPSIRKGDKSRVVAVEPESIRVGDVILVTRDGRMFAHRVVAIEPGPPQRWIIKGDTLLMPDPPVAREDILGQVIGVERRGRLIDLRTPLRRRMGLLMAGLSVPYSRLFARGLILRRRALAKLAALPAWRARRRARTLPVSVRPANDGDADAVAMLFGEQQAMHTPMDRIDMESLRAQARQMKRSADAAGATLWVAEHGGFVSGHAVVGPLNEEGLDAPGWWVMSVYVKMTVRGCGLAERLVQAGLDDAAHRGVPEVRYAAYENNVPSLNLARKIGFAPDDSDVARRFAEYYQRMDPRGARLVVLIKTI